MRNSTILNRLHLISLLVNGLFILLRFLAFRSSLSRETYLLYFILSAPAFVIEFLFERNSRPATGNNGELKKAGDDLDAKGLMEYMFDVLYWTWGNIVLAAFFGDKAWWLWIAVPLYSLWLAYSTFGSVRQGMAGMAGQADGAGIGAMSNRQKKLEARGGLKTRHK